MVIVWIVWLIGGFEEIEIDIVVVFYFVFYLDCCIFDVGVNVGIYSLVWVRLVLVVVLELVLGIYLWLEVNVVVNGL